MISIWCVSVGKLRLADMNVCAQARLTELEEDGKGWFDDAVPDKDKVIQMPPEKKQVAPSVGGGWATAGVAKKPSGGGGGIKRPTGGNPWAALG